MHEVSLMYSILSMVEQTARENNLSKIEKIKLVIGTERVILPDALLFAFHCLKRDPLSDQAELEVEERKGWDFYLEYVEGE